MCVHVYMCVYMCMYIHMETGTVRHAAVLELITET